MKTHQHVVLDDGHRRLVLPIGKEVTFADLVRGLRYETLERVVARGPSPAHGVNPREVVELVELELRRRRAAGIP